MFANKLVHRKGWGTCRSLESYNLSLDCTPCLYILLKMADKISASVLPKVTSPRYISSQRYTPNNVTLKKHRLHFKTGARLRRGPGNKQR